MEVDEPDMLPQWVAGQACLKNEFTEDKKFQNLMSWLKSENCHCLMKKLIVKKTMS